MDLKFPTKLTEHDKFFVLIETYSLQTIETSFQQFQESVSGGSFVQQAAGFLETHTPSDVFDYSRRKSELKDTFRLPLQQMVTEETGGEFSRDKSISGLRTAENLVTGLQSGGAGFIDSLVNTLGAELQDDLAGEGIGAYLESVRGKALNEDKVWSYKGPKSREYPFEFTLVAKNYQDSVELQKIRKRLQYHVSPGQTTGVSNQTFWEYPSMFRFKFLEHTSNGEVQEVKDLFYSKMCWVNNVKIDIGDERFNRFTDGQNSGIGTMKIAMNFTEIDWILRQDFEDDSEYLTGWRNA